MFKIQQQIIKFSALAVALLLVFASCTEGAERSAGRVIESGPAEGLILPAPFATRSVANPPSLIEWPPGKKPVAPAGFTVDLFAAGLDNPRSLLVLPNGDVLVMESLRQGSGSRVILLRDSAHKGFPDRQEPFVTRLNMAYGMALNGGRFYVGKLTALWLFPTTPVIRTFPVVARK